MGIMRVHTAETSRATYRTTVVWHFNDDGSWDEEGRDLQLIIRDPGQVSEWAPVVEGVRLDALETDQPMVITHPSGHDELHESIMADNERYGSQGSCGTCDMAGVRWPAGA